MIGSLLGQARPAVLEAAGLATVGSLAGQLAGKPLLLPLQPPRQWQVPTGHQSFVGQGVAVLVLWWLWEWSSEESSPARRCLLQEASRIPSKQAESIRRPLQTHSPHLLTAVCGLGPCRSAFLCTHKMGLIVSVVRVKWDNGRGVLRQPESTCPSSW